MSNQLSDVYAQWRVHKEPNTQLLLLSALMARPGDPAASVVLAEVMSVVTRTFSSQTRSVRFICQLLFEQDFWEGVGAHLSDLDRLCWILIAYRVCHHSETIDQAARQWLRAEPQKGALYRGLVAACLGESYSAILGHAEAHTPRLIRELLTDMPPFLTAPRCASAENLPEDLI